MTPPSAKDYAAQMAAKLFVGRKGHGGAPINRRAFTQAEVAALVSTAYDAGVLAQQRFAERKP